MGFLEESQSGSKVLERGPFRYGEPSLDKNIMFHMVGDLEFKRLKVAALKLFHPTASPLFR
jgi:hypothetical protein